MTQDLKKQLKTVTDSRNRHANKVKEKEREIERLEAEIRNQGAIDIQHWVGVISTFFEKSFPVSRVYWCDKLDELMIKDIKDWSEQSLDRLTKHLARRAVAEELNKEAMTRTKNKNYCTKFVTPDGSFTKEPQEMLVEVPCAMMAQFKQICNELKILEND